MRKDSKLVLFLILVLFIFNLIGLYTLSLRLEDIIKAVDVLIEDVYKEEEIDKRIPQRN